MENTIKAEKVNLYNHPELTEAWLQQLIAEDPSILGLGDLIPLDKERKQNKAGRLDLLLQDQETKRRYEVEVQLGKVNESHIIRTIEYWDIERKRYPQYDHCAVIVAEDITSRFLNVISLFNGFIPLVAISLSVYKISGKYLPVFTTVLDEMTLGLIEEDEVKEITNREYWEKKGTKETVKIVDSILEMIKAFAPGYELKYNKFYIGLAKNGMPNNFWVFRPRQNNCAVEIKVEESEDTDRKLQEAGIEVISYDKRRKFYNAMITKKDLTQNKDLIMNLLKQAYGIYNNNDDGGASN